MWFFSQKPFETLEKEFVQLKKLLVRNGESTPMNCRDPNGGLGLLPGAEMLTESALASKY